MNAVVQFLSKSFFSWQGKVHQHNGSLDWVISKNEKTKQNISKQNGPGFFASTTKIISVQKKAEKHF